MFDPSRNRLRRAPHFEDSALRPVNDNLHAPAFCPSQSFSIPPLHHLHGYDETKQHPTARPFRQAVFMSVLHGAL